MTLWLHKYWRLLSCGMTFLMTWTFLILVFTIWFYILVSIFNNIKKLFFKEKKLCGIKMLGRRGGGYYCEVVLIYFCFLPQLCSEREYVSVCLWLWNKGLSRQTHDSPPSFFLYLSSLTIDPAHSHLKLGTRNRCSLSLGINNETLSPFFFFLFSFLIIVLVGSYSKYISKNNFPFAYFTVLLLLY